MLLLCGEFCERISIAVLYFIFWQNAEEKSFVILIREMAKKSMTQTNAKS